MEAMDEISQADSDFKKDADTLVSLLQDLDAASSMALGEDDVVAEPAEHAAPAEPPAPSRPKLLPTAKTHAHGQKRFREVSKEEVDFLRREKLMATHLGMTWQDRGPRGEDAPAYFRGQKQRPSGKYANSGGKNKNERREYYQWLEKYKGGYSKPDDDDRFLPMLEARQGADGKAGPFNQGNPASSSASSSDPVDFNRKPIGITTEAWRKIWKEI